MTKKSDPGETLMRFLREHMAPSLLAEFDRQTAMVNGLERMARDYSRAKREAQRSVRPKPKRKRDPR